MYLALYFLQVYKCTYGIDPWKLTNRVYRRASAGTSSQETYIFQRWMKLSDLCLHVQLESAGPVAKKIS